MQAEFMSLQDVGDTLGVDVQTVRRWVKAGRLKAFRPGKDYRIREADLEEFLRTREVRPKVPPQPLPEQAERLRDVRETFGPTAKSLEAYCERWEEKLLVAQAEAGPTPRDVEEFVEVVKGFRGVIGLAYKGEVLALGEVLGLSDQAKEKIAAGVPEEEVGGEIDAQFFEHSVMRPAWQRWVAVGPALAESVDGEEAQRVRRALAGSAA